MENRKQANNSIANTMAQTVYESDVNRRVVERVGKMNPSQSKGIVHEVLYTDKMNLTHPSLGKTTMTKNQFAMRDDVVSINNGVVKHRAQLKDTISSTGINKTVEQAVSGKYKGTNLMGTNETTALYNANPKSINAQKMTSTGISSKDTQRIADTFCGRTTSLENVAYNATRGGKSGAIMNVGVGLIEDLVNDKTVDEMVVHATSNGVRGFAAGYAGSVAATAVTTATAAGIASAPVIATSVPLVAFAAPVVAGIGAAALASTVVMELTDGEVKDAIEDVAHDVVGFVSDVGDSAISAIEDVVTSGLDCVSNALDDFASSVSSFFDWF